MVAKLTEFCLILLNFFCYSITDNILTSKSTNVGAEIFEKYCGSDDVMNGKSLGCICKRDPIFKYRCGVKIEIFNDVPLIAIIRGLFKDKVSELSVNANSANFKNIRFGSEYGVRIKSEAVKGENGVLESSDYATTLIYQRLSANLGIVDKCATMVEHPKATVVKYKHGDYFGLHYDANNYTLETHFGLWFGGHLIRRFVESLETCRHRYNSLNIWICLFQLYMGRLQTTEYWDTYSQGPRLLSALIQLSDVEGGRTFFPRSGVSIGTNKGDMLIWANVDDDWNRYDKSMHGGCPVLSREKLIIVVFIPGMCNTMYDINYNLISY